MGEIMNPDDRHALDILASSPDGATEQVLGGQGVCRDILERLIFAGYLRHETELFNRSRGATGPRFYLTSAGRKARTRQIEL
jgi:hypothetical protein